ncbi:MAG: response regulator [Clostridia bacterium]|nr:response regulator [Clostridia bacterium]MBQ6992008.1 response regulator [Clostridia bacterium]
MEKTNKVMIIDDEKTFIIPLEVGLKRHGVDVVSFTDPEEAIQYLKNNKVDVLLTDYHMEPSINGDEVIRRIREFNKDIIIYLQTGYAEMLPAEEMLEKYDIQGYIDKGEGQEKNYRLIKSALKHAQTLELVKEQEKQIDAQTYRNDFFGKFLYRFIGEIKEKGMVIGGLVNSITIERETISEEEFEKYSNNIKIALKSIMEMIESLEIEEKTMISITDLEQLLNSLFNIDFKIKNAKLDIKNENNIFGFTCDIKTIVYILTDIIEYLLEQEEKEICFSILKEEDLYIEVLNEIKNKEIIEKIKKLVLLTNEIEIMETNGNVKIIIK